MAKYTAKYESGNSIQKIEIEAEDLDNSKKDVITLVSQINGSWVNIATFNREKLIIVYRNESKIA
ncbi:MAG: hypothetical protein NXI08_11570 [bacterium]|nr:hypothetical protein [bacterium]